MKRTAVGLALLGVVSVAGAGAAWWWLLPQYKVRQQISLALKDPSSAVFESVTYNRSSKTGCGFVNAKNSFGGYVGHNRFLWTEGEPVEFDPGEGSATLDAREKLAALQEQLTFFQKWQARCSASADK